MGTSVKSSSLGMIAKIRTALGALKHKDGSLSSLYVNGNGNLYVIDSQIAQVIESLGDVLQSLQNTGTINTLQNILDKLKEILESRKSALGDWKSAEIAASGTISGAVDIGGHYANLQIKIPTITSAQLELQVSREIDGTYQDLSQNFLTELGTGTYNDTWVLGGWRFIKIKASAAQTTAVQFDVRGVTY